MGMSQDLAFQLYQVSHEKYGCAASALDHGQHEDAVRIAKRKIRIEEVVLASQEAARVVIPSRQIDETLREINDRYDEEFSLAEELDVLGIDENYLEYAVQKDLKVSAVLDYVSSNESVVSDTDVNLYYYMNIDKFRQPEVRTARHILVTINDEVEESRRDKAEKKIFQIANRLSKKPDRFEEQALKHSECPTALQGGLLGQVKPGTLYPELETELYRLKLGKLSGVVESQLGFHILRCDEIQEAGTIPFNDVALKLKEFLTQKERKKAQREWLDHLLKNSNSVGEKVHG